MCALFFSLDGTHQPRVTRMGKLLDMGTLDLNFKNHEWGLALVALQDTSRSEDLPSRVTSCVAIWSQRQLGFVNEGARSSPSFVETFQHFPCKVLCWEGRLRKKSGRSLCQIDGGVPFCFQLVAFMTGQGWGGTPTWNNPMAILPLPHEQTSEKLGGFEALAGSSVGTG